MSQSKLTDERHPLRLVVLLTGLTLDLLRVWRRAHCGRPRPPWGRRPGRIDSVPDSPRVVPETPFQSKTWEWWPGTESNHRTRGFSVRRSPRFGATKPKKLEEFAAGPTEPPRPTDRAPAEPRAGRPTEHRGEAHEVHGG
jgi:hypothetical protein